MRHPKACAQCRESKRKCLHQSTGRPCISCRDRQVQCSLQFKPPPTTSQAPRLLIRRDPEQSAAAHPPGPLPDLPQTVAQQLVGHYLDKIHDRPHSLFHPATLRENVRDGAVSRALLLALCSMGARFSTGANTRQLAVPLMNEAKRLVLSDLENISLENAQCCILVANLCAAYLNPSSEALFFRIANGMAQIMGLDSAPRDASIVQREVKRRVWWTLVMADRWASTGLGLPRQIADVGGKVELPMDEGIFNSLTTHQETLGCPWSPGLWAQMIFLVDVFGPIQDLNRKSATGEAFPDEIHQSVEHLSRRLENWEQTLPVQFKMTNSNLHHHKERGTGGAFIALHLGYHHYSTLLYFQFLEQKQSTLGPSSKSYVEKCKFHASSYSKLLSESRAEGRSSAVYPTVAHMAVVSSSVLVHTLLYGEENELEDARDGLNSNFEAITELEKYWPNCAFMVERLVIFQNSCLLADLQHTHHLDGWMVRFLMEHSLPLNNKEPRVMDTGMTNQSADLSTRAQELAEQGRYTTFELSGFQQREGF